MSYLPSWYGNDVGRYMPVGTHPRARISTPSSAPISTCPIPTGADWAITVIGKKCVYPRPLGEADLRARVASTMLGRPLALSMNMREFLELLPGVRIGSRPGTFSF